MRSDRSSLTPAMAAALCGLALLLGSAAGGGAANPVFIKGADVSSLPRIEAGGGVFTEDGRPRDLFEILRDHGFNFIRLRLWHTPGDGYCGLDRTLAMAERTRAADMGLLLDIHYSDTWADPGTQDKPAAWAGVPFPALRDSVYRYTRDVMTALKNNDTPPDMVQIGNEITCGMLWDDGCVCGDFDIADQWDNLAALVGEGIRGIHDGLSPADSVRIMIHVDRGGDVGGSTWFYDNLLLHGVEFDVIGLSFYPWWHGTLEELSTNLDSLAVRYGRDIVIVETAYPWTLDWSDEVPNIVGRPGQLHDGYPASVAGQRAFFTDLLNIVARTPGGRGVGVFLWAPEWISTPSAGSPWENLTLFDFSGSLLGSVGAFEDPSGGGPEPERPPATGLGRSAPARPAVPGSTSIRPR